MTNLQKTIGNIGYFTLMLSVILQSQIESVGRVLDKSGMVYLET